MAPILSELFLGRQSDERLVALARRGHSQAFVAIVSRYQDELLAFARGAGAEARAEDVVQQALLNAFVALRAGTRVTHLRGWLYAIVRRTVAPPAAGPPIAGVAPDPAAATEPLEDLVLVRARAQETLAAVRALPRRQRQALMATVFQGHSRADIARMLGQSEGSVRQLVHRARTNVRNAVGAVVPYPFVRWLPALRHGAPAGDLGASAVAAPSAGLVAKVGVVLASGLVVTGIAVAPHRGVVHSHHRATPPARAVGAPVRRAAVSALVQPARPPARAVVARPLAVPQPVTVVARRSASPTWRVGGQTRQARSQGDGQQQSSWQPVMRRPVPQRPSSGRGGDGSRTAVSNPGGSSPAGGGATPAPVSMDTASGATEGGDGGSTGGSGSTDGGWSGTGSSGGVATSDG